MKYRYDLKQASKRQPGTSGRLHRTVTGEWVWSSEEEDSASSGEEGKEALPVNTIENASSEEDLEQDEFYSQVKTTQSHAAIQAAEQNVPINLVLRLRYISNTSKELLLNVLLFDVIVYTHTYIQRYPCSRPDTQFTLAEKPKYTSILPDPINICFKQVAIFSTI